MSRPRLATVHHLTPGRPPAPDELTPEQAEVWRAAVRAMPADWFGAETQPLLAAYCKCVTRQRWLAAAVETNRDKLLKAENGIAALDKLLAACERESRSMLAYARGLRLTIQSRYDARTAGRADRNAPECSYYDLPEAYDD